MLFVEMQKNCKFFSLLVHKNRTPACTLTFLVLVLVLRISTVYSIWSKNVTFHAIAKTKKIHHDSIRCSENWFESGILIPKNIPWYYCYSSTICQNQNWIWTENAKLSRFTKNVMVKMLINGRKTTQQINPYTL